MKRKKIGLFVAALAAFAVIGLGGCSSPWSQVRNDLEGVAAVDPDYAVAILSADGYPNIMFTCYAGTPILTTTRQDSIPPQLSALPPSQFPELAAICRGKAKSPAQ